MCGAPTISQPKRKHVDGAAVDVPVGATERVQLSPGEWEVRCSVPIVVHDGSTTACSLEDVPVSPDAPARFVFSAPVVCVAASTEVGGFAWFSPVGGR
jgi:hypothetical protein